MRHKLYQGSFYERPSLAKGDSVDAVLCWPSRTPREYLNSFLLTNRSELDEVKGQDRTRKNDMMSVLEDEELRTILYAKRYQKIKTEHDIKCIALLDRELSYRTGSKKYGEKVDLEQKKAEVDILDVIESYGGLGSRYRQGQLVKCMLPDHKDSTPSMSINQKKGYWKCFGCQKGGSAIDFIMEMEGCSLKEAITKFLQF